MTFDTKKMILVAIAVFILLVLFLNIALTRIQSVKLKIEVDENIQLLDSLAKIANEIIDLSNNNFVDEIAISDMNMNILLVDNIGHQAVLLDEDEIKPIDYSRLDKSIIYCNSYFVKVKNKNTVIVNTDPILGNSTCNAIVGCYNYKFNKMDTLSPSKVDYFQTLDDDVMTSYYRYSMIEALKEVYFDSKDLTLFKRAYTDWMESLDGVDYYEYINYDFYDGFRLYIESQVLAEIDENFDLYAYISSYKNQYGIYSNTSEFALMGLLYCYVCDKNGVDILSEENQVADKYRVLTKNTALGDIDYLDELKDYKDNNDKYIQYISKLSDDMLKKYKDTEPKELILVAETYDDTICVSNNVYIYTNYLAKDSENNIIIKDNMLVNIQPYKVLYYFD